LYRRARWREELVAMGKMCSQDKSEARNF